MNITSTFHFSHFNSLCLCFYILLVLKKIMLLPIKSKLNPAIPSPPVLTAVVI